MKTANSPPTNRIENKALAEEVAYSGKPNRELAISMAKLGLNSSFYLDRANKVEQEKRSELEVINGITLVDIPVRHGARVAFSATRDYDPNTTPTSEVFAIPRHLSPLDKYEMSWPKTATASLLATIAFTAVGAKQGKLPSFELFPERDEITANEVVDTTNSLRVIDSEQTQVISESTSTSHEEDFHVNNMLWAQEFSGSSEAQQLNQEQFEAASDYLIDVLGQEGVADLQVTITGHASAEDRGTAEDESGLQTPSAENQDLAETRLNSFLAQLEQRTQDANVEIPEESLQTDAIEHEFTDSQLRVTEQLAERYGYGSAKQMVEQRNRSPEESPPQVANWLSTSLEQQRGVTMNISFTLNGVEQHVEIVTEPGMCIYEQDTILQEVVVQTERDAIRQYLPLPLIIPILQRRKDESEKDESSDDGSVNNPSNDNNSTLFDEPVVVSHEADDAADSVIEDNSSDEGTNTIAKNKDADYKSGAKPGRVHGAFKTTRAKRIRSSRRTTAKPKPPNKQPVDTERGRKAVSLAFVALALASVTAQYSTVEFEANCILNKISVQKESGELTMDIDFDPDCTKPESSPKAGPTVIAKGRVCPPGFEQIFTESTTLVPATGDESVTTTGEGSAISNTITATSLTNDS